MPDVRPHSHDSILIIINIPAERPGPHRLRPEREDNWQDTR